MKYYTGIGSRETPREILDVMKRLATALERKGYILRSGGAGGADDAFENGVVNPQMKNIYLPWKGFNGRTSSFYNIPDKCFELAQTIHPAWNKCSQGAQKLHARNTQQVLGTNLDSPSQFVVCWTSNGLAIGGTATAINLAIANGINVYNLRNPHHLKRITDMLAQMQC